MSSKTSRVAGGWARGVAAVTLALVGLAIGEASAAQVSLGIQSDLSKPTYGLQGQSSSQVHYDDKSGLNMKGTINDILGPPIKIANGFGNILSGSEMAGVGASLKSGGAVLGVDAKMLEAAGGEHLLRGGLLFGGAAAKTGIAAAAAGPAGKKIASIIEFPVKVVALKDIAAGKALKGLGAVKGAEAVAMKTKGTNMVKEGEAMKTQGFNQMLQGASEGMHNIGNMVQQTSENANTAFKLLPIVLDLPMPQQQQQVQQHEQDATKTRQQSSELGGNPLTGGSLFGGLNSLMSGLTTSTTAGSDPLASASSNQINRNPFNLFGAPTTGGEHHGYAALLNATNPFTNLLMNPGMNPLLMPIVGGPLGQSIMGKAPSGASGSGATGLGSLMSGLPNGQSSTYNYNLFPGIRVTETTSSHLPALGKTNEQQHIHQQQHQVQAPTKV